LLLAQAEPKPPLLVYNEAAKIRLGLERAGPDGTERNKIGGGAEAKPMYWSHKLG
jgi:hypothetical protein